ncbi:MAG: LPS export ABC transporter permease LptG [gamma proteobacterium endosymbiont of Lamellibrachia anaximandri]|nr:LPS export ABC transporter permease LptG [gamma proteobacterium endosymbiont of Lamellibrachia anaximandri]MBL3616799.1 LPS export ABC transporter permease LptG [gamma proteobacterium endosymbiont of Lamellibrachia anaximandri]
MTNLLDRYIGRSVALGMLMVLALLLVLLGFFSVLGELEEVGKGSYTTVKAFTYVLLILPRYTYEIFPVATLLGSLIGLGALANNSELIAMRAAGVSISRIVGAVLKTGFVMLLVILAVGELLAPVTEQRAQRMKMDALSDQVTLQTKYGFWARDGDTFINIRRILPDSTLADISIYEYGAGRELLRATHADTARYADPEWELDGVEQSEFGAGRIATKQLERLRWSTLLEPALLDVVTVQPHMLPAWDLWSYIRYLTENGQDAATYEVAFWGKVVSPLVTLVMLFLSVPFVFGALRSVSIGQRIFTGAVIGTVFYLVNRAFSYLAVVYDINPLFAASFPTLLCLFLAFWFFRRVH